MATNEKTCTSVRRTVDITIECEAPSHVGRYASYRYDYGTPEYWKKLEENINDWCKEFEEFIRDHRSQDPVALHVRRVETDFCSECGSVWEPVECDGTLCCAHCGANVKDESKTHTAQGASHEQGK